MAKTKPERMIRVTLHLTEDQLLHLEKRAKSEGRTLAGHVRFWAQTDLDKSKKGARK